MPLRVSGVPPLLLVTMTSVSGSSPFSVSSMRAMPSGSVLSMKCIFMRSEEGSPSASPTNIGPERRAADADREHLRESFRPGRLDFSRVHAGGKFLNGFHRAGDFQSDFFRRRELRRAQPVMPYHSFFVRIGDCAAFQGVHVLECLLHGGFHRRKKRFVEMHAADIQREVERIHAAEILAVAFPKFGCVHGVSLGF